MACDTRFHCGSNAQGLVDAAEVVIGEPKRLSGFQMLPTLAEAVGQPRHAAHSHPYAQVLAFDMRVQIRLLTGFPMTSTGTESTASTGL
jgi:hypothetical protein